MFIRPRIIPVLSIDDRDLIKTVQFDKRRYLGDPVNAVKIFNRKGIDELAVLDISATKKGKEPDWELLQDIASEAFMPLSYGGGITNVEQVRRLIAIGYEKVVINTALIEDIEMVEEAIALVGSQSVVASIDAVKRCGEYKCVIRDGSKVIDISPVALARQMEAKGVGEIFLNSVDCDGMTVDIQNDLLSFPLFRDIQRLFIHTFPVSEISVCRSTRRIGTSRFSHNEVMRQIHLLTRRCGKYKAHALITLIKIPVFV